jgi:hypothetical protein
MSALLTAASLAVILVVTTVLFHFVVLQAAWAGLDGGALRPKRRVLAAVAIVLVAHLVEIGLYGFAYWFADQGIDICSFGGSRPVAFFFNDTATTEIYTTLGLGDIYPVGDMRLIASIEVLNGVLLYTWSGSFTFLVMQRFWKKDPVRSD